MIPLQRSSSSSCLVSVVVAALVAVALLSSFTAPADAFTIYRIAPDADWLVSSGGTSELDEDEDSFEDFGEMFNEGDEGADEDEDVAAFDQGALEDAEVVVEDDEVLPAWAGADVKGLVLAEEDVHDAFTSFVIELDEPASPSSEQGALKAEQFSPPNFFLSNKAVEDNVLTIAGHGDGLFGSMDETDPASKFYVFRIEYFCKVAGKSKISVEFKFVNMMEEVKNVSFTWTKVCGTGERTGLFIDAILGDEKAARSVVVADGKVDGQWLKPYNHKIPFGVHTTNFNLRMGKASGSQDMGEPVISISNPKVLQVASTAISAQRIHATEEASYGPSVLTEEMPKALAIIYKCLMLSEEDIEVTVKYSVGSFQAVEFGWLKSCSQVGTHQDLKISTVLSPALEGDVYSKGSVLPDWAAPDHLVDKNVSMSTFYLSAKSFVPFSYPRLTVQPGTTLRARLVGVQGALGPKSEIWVDADPIPLRVEYKCLQRGKVVLRLSMVATDLHDTIQFAWTKECATPSRPPKRPSAPYLTANRALLLFTLTVVTVGAMIAWGYQTWANRQRETLLARRRAVEEDVYPF